MHTKEVLSTSLPKIALSIKKDFFLNSHEEFARLGERVLVANGNIMHAAYPATPSAPSDA